MKPTPTRCVVDTNVATTANSHEPESARCAATSARALARVMKKGHLFIDDGGRIVQEYRGNLSARGQPGPGDAFLKWVLTHEWSGERVTRVPITPTASDPERFAELSEPAPGVHYDRSDEKFLAVAAASPEHPPVLQALDSKWWGWTRSLAQDGVRIHFLCARDIARKYRSKMGKRPR